MKEKIGLLLRVSSKPQETDGKSLEVQENIGRKVVKSLGFEPIIFNEGVQSSYDVLINERPILVELIEEITKKRIKKVWVLNTDNSFNNINNILKYLDRPTIDTKCPIDWNSCNPTSKPCTSQSKTCIASFCSKLKENYTDKTCNDCITDPKGPACKLVGFCEEEITYPTSACKNYISLN